MKAGRCQRAKTYTKPGCVRTKRGHNAEDDIVYCSVQHQHRWQRFQRRQKYAVIIAGSDNCGHG